MPKLKPPEEMGYEQAFQELEAAVRRLESGELALEEALAAFERGQALAARCSELLDRAELRLNQLAPDEAGEYHETEIEPGDEVGE